MEILETRREARGEICNFIFNSFLIFIYSYTNHLMDNFLFKQTLFRLIFHIFIHFYLPQKHFHQMSSLSWNELILQITLLFQQTNDPTVKLEISGNQILLYKNDEAETTWSTTVRKIGREVINAWDDPYEPPSDILSNENVIRNCWDEIKTSRNSADVLAIYFEIGKSISQYMVILQTINPETDPLIELLPWLQRITELRQPKFLYKACLRLYALFDSCPQVVKQIGKLLTITKLGRMKKEDYDELHQEISALKILISQ